jgi:acyl carrier protein
VALRAGAHVDPQALRQHVGRNVMPAMVPSQVVVLGALPLTPNGKVDRKALPAPHAATPAAAPGGSAASPAPATRASTPAAAPVGDAGEANATRIEATVSAIWADALGKPAGLNDNFFEIGGHSLMAIIVFRKLTEQLPVKLALTDIFRFPTIRALAAHVHAAWPKPAAQPADTALTATPPVGASPGTPPPLDRGALRRRALQQRGGT